MAAPASGTGRRILRLSRASGETSLAVIVSKAPHALQDAASDSDRNLACLAIVDPGRQSTPAPEVLMELFRPDTGRSTRGASDRGGQEHR